MQSSPGPDDAAAAVGRNISEKASEVGWVEVSSTRMGHILRLFIEVITNKSTDNIQLFI